MFIKEQREGAKRHLQDALNLCNIDYIIDYM